MSAEAKRPLLKTQVVRTTPKPDGNSFKYDDEIRFEIEPVDQRGGHRAVARHVGCMVRAIAC